MKLLSTLVLLLVTVVSHAADLELTDGRILKNFRILESDTLGVMVLHSDGAENVPFEVCPLDVQATYEYEPAKAAKLKAANAIKLQQQEEQLEIQAERREQKRTDRTERLARETPPPTADIKTTPREISFLENLDRPFGLRIGDKFKGQASPYRTSAQVEYHYLADVPNRAEEFGEYTMLVGEGSKKVIGVEATGRYSRISQYHASVSVITARLNKAYGKPIHRQPDRNGSETWLWSKGSMKITLEGFQRHRLKLEFKLPH